MERPRVVIVGGGFGGINVAKKLGKLPVEITLIDKANHHLFQPLLYQVATATLSPADVAMPIRHILRKQKNTEVVLGEVIGLDSDKKLVLVKDLEPFPYDYLVIATGATHSYFGHPDWERYAHGLKSIEDATLIRGEVLLAFEYAERSREEAEQREWLSFILVGAGPTGVELAGAISEIANRVLEGDFRHIDPGLAKVILVEAGPRILSAYAPDLSEKAMKGLQRLKVDVSLNTVVQEIDEKGVSTNNGRIEGRTVIWAAGVQASAVASWLGVEPDRSGRVHVESDLSVAGRPGVFVIGDCMTLEQDGQPLPGVAQVAIQQGKYVARQIASMVRDNRKSESPNPQSTKGFRYRDLGSLATIGRSSAIAQFGKVHIAGWIAWWIWLFVHIMNLVGFRNKVLVLVQWAWAYFSWDRGARLITPRDGDNRKTCGATEELGSARLASPRTKPE